MRQRFGRQLRNWSCAMALFRRDPARFDGLPLSTFTPIVAANNTDPGAPSDNSQASLRQPASWR